VAKRGEVYLASLPHIETPKYVVVVSRDVISEKLQPITVLLTGNPRPRSLPTDVEVTPTRELPLPAEICWALCHDVLVIPPELLGEYVGEMPLGKMIEIERGLRYVFDMETDDDVARRDPSGAY
jgi:mRNA-degrading endonuclease toxin of MazEF toxin-antitoxin module